MKRALTRILATAAVVAALLPSIAAAQTPSGDPGAGAVPAPGQETPATGQQPGGPPAGPPPQASAIAPPEGFAALRDRFEGLDAAAIQALGYQIDPHCVTAAEVGLPASYGAMGFHAINPRLFGQQWGGNWSQGAPPILVLDANRRVVGVEWEASRTIRPAPTLFGQVAPLLPGHPGPPEVNEPHYMLHAYFAPDGQVLFDVFNPGLECPIQGRLNGSRDGNFALYEFDYPGDSSVYTINLWVSPDAVVKEAGFRVYNPGGSVHVTGGGQSGLSPNVSANVISTNKGRHIVQVYNYSPVPVTYELQLVRGAREGG